MRALLAFLLLWPFGPKIRKDESVAFHWVPGVWQMLFQVGGENISAEIVDPRGRRCSWDLMIRGRGRGFANAIPDCDVDRFAGRESGVGAHDPFFDLETWRPVKGEYRIRVKGLGRNARAAVSVGNRYARRAFWQPTDTLSAAEGQEYRWIARWEKRVGLDSLRVSLRRE